MNISTNAEMLFNNIARFVADSRSLLASGEMMQLAGLEDQVRTLCDSVLQLSQEERILHAERLQQLLGDLKQLGDEMVASRDKLADEIRGVDQFKKASVAYRTVNAIDSKKKGEDDER